jgi:hypothetical protein
MRRKDKGRGRKSDSRDVLGLSCWWRCDCGSRCRCRHCRRCTCTDVSCRSCDCAGRCRRRRWCSCKRVPAYGRIRIRTARRALGHSLPANGTILLNALCMPGVPLRRERPAASMVDAPSVARAAAAAAVAARCVCVAAVAARCCCCGPLSGWHI